VSKSSDGVTSAPDAPDAKPVLAVEAPPGAAAGRPTYPDDGPLAQRLRRVDAAVGRAEQIALVVILAALVLTAATHAVLDRVAHIHVPFKEQVIRGGTFAMAMLGAAFASHQARHLSMDLVSRRISPRARLMLRVAIALFTIAIVALLTRSGFHVIAKEAEFTKDDQLLSSVRVAYLIPIGGSLIIFHTLLHAIVDLDYIRRGKAPPERMRSAH
jgi:TRAP-type C4-dicarboxylate transport system permease small subunit